MERAQHNLGLDLVRSGAILAVLFSHAAEWFLPPGPQTNIQAAYIGTAGVEVFFSLSGFLIGGILLRAIEQGPDPRALLRFWTRRWMRTLPAYWVVILGLSLYFGAADWRSPIFLQNFVPRTEWTPLTPHTWSLVLEEWFYLFVPLLLAAAAALLGRSRVRWAAPLVCVGLIAACIVGRGVAGLQPSALWGADPSINPVLRLDCASWGVLAAWLAWRGVVPRGVALALVAAGGAMVVLVGCVWVRLFQPELLVPYGIDVWGWAWQPLQPALVECAAALMVLGLHRLAPRGSGVLAWTAGAIARLSYALYLVHIPVIYLARGAGVDDAAGWLPRLELTLLVLGAALVLRYAIELPVLALRDRLAPERRIAMSHGNSPSTPSANSAVNAGMPGGR